jgi:hypothetical protein
MLNQNLFADIKKLLIESHTKEEIQNLSTSELKKLHGKYLAMGTDDAKKEAAEIKKEIESRGEDDGETKPVVAQQNEELLMILDVLCEVAGFDMMTLVEETIGQMQHLAHASGWDKPAPEGAASASDRLKRVLANAKRLGKRRVRDAIPAGDKTQIDIEDAGEDNVHERPASAGGGVARDPIGFEGIQNDIDGIGQTSAFFKPNKGKKPNSLVAWAGLSSKSSTAPSKGKGKKPNSKTKK